MRFLYALADVRDPVQMARVLELSMSAEVRTQNAPFLIAACIANRDNGALAWRLVHERWDEMNERFPSNSIVRMMSGMRSVSRPRAGRGHRGLHGRASAASGQADPPAAPGAHEGQRGPRREARP